jgi:hypothetical protein
MEDESPEACASKRGMRFLFKFYSVKSCQEHTSQNLKSPLNIYRRDNGLKNMSLEHCAPKRNNVPPTKTPGHHLVMLWQTRERTSGLADPLVEHLIHSLQQPSPPSTVGPSSDLHTLERHVVHATMASHERHHPVRVHHVALASHRGPAAACRR